MNFTFSPSDEYDMAMCNKYKDKRFIKPSAEANTQPSPAEAFKLIYGGGDIVSCWLSVGHSDNEMEIGKTRLKVQQRAAHTTLFLINPLFSSGCYAGPLSLFIGSMLLHIYEWRHCLLKATMLHTGKQHYRGCFHAQRLVCWYCYWVITQSLEMCLAREQNIWK